MKTPKPRAGSGRVTGSPDPAPDLLSTSASSSGRARKGAPPIAPEKPFDGRAIVIRGAREHNLKNVDLTIPRDKLVVFTGLSGSGKSSLAFDTIYAEGQRSRTTASNSRSGDCPPPIEGWDRIGQEGLMNI
jgi:excinuclease ABC subunit A